MLEKEQERRKEGGDEGGLRAPVVRQSCVNMTTFPLMRALCSSGGEWQQGLHQLLVPDHACELCTLMVNLDAFTWV